MLETVEVTLIVRLPRAVAAQAKKVQKTDPEFLSRVVLYGLTRRSIYRHLKKMSDEGQESGAPLMAPAIF